MLPLFSRIQPRLPIFAFSNANDNQNIINLIKKTSASFRNKDHQEQLQLMNIKLNDNLQYYKKFLNYPNKTHSYCAEFSRAVVLSTLQNQKKVEVFRQIKNSLKNNKKVFNTECATKIVQNLCFFQFQGDQFVHVSQLADYFEQKKQAFTEKLRNRFQLAYKDIMVNKAIGPVKFRPIDFKTQYSQSERKMKQLEKLYRQIDKTCTVNSRKGFLQVNLSGLHLRIYSYSNKMKKQTIDDLFVSIKITKNVKNIALLQNQNLSQSKLALGNKQNTQHHQSISFLEQLKQRLESQQSSVKIYRFQTQNLIQCISNRYKLKHLQQVYGYISILNFYQNFQHLNFAKQKSIKLKKPLQLNKDQDTNFVYKYLNYQSELLQTFRRNLNKIDKRVQNGVFLVHEEDIIYFKSYLQKLIQLVKQTKAKISDQPQNDQLTQEKLNLLKVLFKFNQPQSKYWKIMSPL